MAEQRNYSPDDLLDEAGSARARGSLYGCEDLALA